MTRIALLLVLLTGAATLPPVVRGPRRIDANHSTIGFSVPIAGGISEVTGKFTEFTLDFDYDPEHPENSRVVAVLDAASVDTGIDARDKHLQAEDFLHVAEFPEIVFESFEVVPAEEAGRLSVIGVLTLRGESHDVTLDVLVLPDPIGGDQVGFHATTTFDRQKVGVRYKHRDIPTFSGDEIRVEMHVLTRASRKPGRGR